jgi:poly-gamma-glutamate capsule biosynthesis protein CapA/YwtB (metallophosphatase superfamily)
MTDRKNRGLNARIAAALSSRTGTARIDVSDGAAAQGASGTLLILGDVALAGCVGEAIEEHGDGFPFSCCPEGFFNADAICLNLECCLSDRGGPVEPKPVHLVGRACYLAALPRPQGCIASVANNHFLDFGPEASLDTLTALDRAGVRYIGAVGSAVTSQPVIQQTPGGSVGFLAFTTCAHSYSRGAPVGVAHGWADAVVRTVEAARGRADVVVVVFHHGVEYCSFPHPRDRALCREALAHGADLVVCHHPHVLQGIEAFGEGVVFHSIGDFALGTGSERRPAAARMVAVRAHIAERRLRYVDVEPFVLNEQFQPVPAGPEESRSILAHLHGLSVALHDDRSARRCAGLARRARVHARVGNAWSMLRRRGVAMTARYYLNRIASSMRLG